MVRIEFRGVTKRFGSVTAVDDLSFTVEPGRVTGFLGPNGSGKTTTLAILLGLLNPTAGMALVDGTAYRNLERPVESIGAVIDQRFHPGRSGRNHLRVVATAAGIDHRRIDLVLEQVDLAGPDARRRAGTYSLGMRQRLALATALLGDPPVLVLDEPANGLDPEGMRWLRLLLRSLADEGRTVLLSSHVLSEVAQIVDDVVVISHGRLRASASIEELRADLVPRLHLRSPDIRRAYGVLAERGLAPCYTSHDSLSVEGVAGADVGRALLDAAIEVHELTPLTGDLEEVYLGLVAAPNPPPPTGAPLVPTGASR